MPYNLTKSILKERILNTSSENKLFLLSVDDTNVSNCPIPIEVYQSYTKLSAFGQTFLFNLQIPSSSDLENDRNLTVESMKMSESSFSKLWDNEDDSYWNNY